MEANGIVAEVVDALARLGIPSMLVGSYSSNYYGVARATRDADFVIQVDQQPISRLAQLLGPDYQMDPQMSFETVTATMRHVLVRSASKFKIELFLLSGDAHDRTRFERRRPTEFLGRSIHLPTPEDVIITKLRWSKGGNRQKDVEDVRHVMAIQRDGLDLAYVRRWCDTHGTREIFEKLLTDVSQI